MIYINLSDSDFFDFLFGLKNYFLSMQEKLNLMIKIFKPVENNDI